MGETCFVFSGKYFWFEEEDLKEHLKQIALRNNFYRGFDKERIDDFLQKWNDYVERKHIYFYFKYPSYYVRMKEWLFLYHIKDILLDENIWISIPIPKVNEDQINSYKNLAKKYGEYRYDVDNGWKGVFAEELINNFLKGLKFKEFKDEKKFDGITNGYDIKINDYKIDIKCATQLNYLEITPKVIVEQEKIKHFYIASKWFDNTNTVVIIGYFEHSDITNYQFKFLYGTPYWAVKLYDAKPISDLINKLKN